MLASLSWIGFLSFWLGLVVLQEPLLLKFNLSPTGFDTCMHVDKKVIKLHQNLYTTLTYNSQKTGHILFLLLIALRLNLSKECRIRSHHNGFLWRMPSKNS